MAAAEDYASWIVANQAKKGTPEFDTVAKAYQTAKAAPAPEAAPVDPTGSFLENLAAGVGKSIVDTGRGVKQLVSHVVPGMDTEAITKEIADARARDAALMQTGGGVTGDIAGNVGMALLPGGALKAAGVLARAGGAANTAGALNAAGGAVLAPRTVKGALATGAAMGAAQPTVDSGEQAINTGVSSVASAALPALFRALAVGKSALEPFYDKGKEQILGRLYNRAAGNEAPAAQAALAAAQDLVPGSMPTAGQAAGNAGIAALERTASAIEPAATQAFSIREAAQNAARLASLETVAGEPGKRAFFEADRKAAAKQLYDAAYQKGVDIGRHPETGQFLPKTVIAGRKGEITKLLQRPAIQDALSEARALAANEGEKVPNLTSSVKGLDYVQRALSDKISRATGNEQRILVNLRDRLLTTIDTLSPDYQAARQTFREMSKPINRMDVGAEIANKSVNKLTGQLQPAAFARALSDETAARATGFGGATLANTMAPQELAALDAIKTDLARATFAKNAGRGAGSDTVQKLAYSNFIDAAGVPTWLRNSAPAQITGGIASRAADVLYGRANRELASKLASYGLDPHQVARAMSMASQPGNERLVGMLTRGGSAIGRTAALALINAQQQ